MQEETASDREQNHRVLSGIRVLLTEDNRINSEIASEILLDAGAEVDIAENGKDAVKAVSTNRYDVVLMDIQMPEMDGLEATRRIRVLAPDGGPYLPIIAMTAHTLAKDRQECLHAGMDDFLSKPIEPDLLIHMLQKWARKDSSVTLGKNTHQAPEMAVVQGIDMQTALRRVRGNKPLFIRLLKSFETESEAILSGVRTALAGEQARSAQKWIHKLKGTAGNLSLSRVHHLAARLEELVAENKTDLAGFLLPELENALAEISMAVDLLGPPDENLPGRETPTDSPGKIREMFRELSGLLADHNLRAQSLAEALIREISGQDQSGALTELETKMSLFDFKGAQKALHRVADQMGIPWEE